MTAQPSPRAPCGWLVALPSLLAPGDAHHTEKSSTWAGHPAGRLLAPALLGREPRRLPKACLLRSARRNFAVSVSEVSAPNQGVQPAPRRTPWERSYATFLIPGIPWVQILQPLDPCCSHTAHGPASSLMLINDCCVSY